MSASHTPIGWTTSDPDTCTSYWSHVLPTGRARVGRTKNTKRQEGLWQFGDIQRLPAVRCGFISCRVACNRLAIYVHFHHYVEGKASAPGQLMSSPTGTAHHAGLHTRRRYSTGWGSNTLGLRRRYSATRPTGGVSRSACASLFRMD